MYTLTADCDIADSRIPAQDPEAPMDTSRAYILGMEREVDLC